MFNVTLQEFRDFCAETNYMQLKGQGALDLTIDRLDEEKGYSRDNIQTMLLGDNIRKYALYRRKNWGRGIKGLDRQPGDPF